MDPVTALGVAAATVQFLDFSFQALALCRQVRDDVQGATQANKELEQYAKTIASSRADLVKSQNNTTLAGKRISKSAADCVQAADDLIMVLAKVRSAGNKTLLNTANTVLRALKQGRTIEKLENRLRACQATLDTALLQDIHITQHSAFSELDGQVKALRTKIQELQLESTRNSVAVQTQLDGIRSQNTSLITTLTSHHSSSTQQLSRLQNEMHSRFDRLDLKDMKIHQQEILNSLFYPELTAREEHVKFPNPNTFNWIFNKTIPDASSFSNWLKTNGTPQESIYWISGKAGSGKSTLMRHIASSTHTQDHLEQWANGDDLRILKHFFWKPGTQLQTSIDGLLRSLLHQLLQPDPDLISTISTAQSLSRGRIPLWTAERLRTAITTAISHITLRNQPQRICVFLDGLDEYQGSDSGVDELMEVIFTLANTPLVKVCASSRPEIAFSSELSLYPSLTMEKLNYDDIVQYVQTKLNSLPNASTWVHKIVTMAKGVFLWVVLVARSIRQGFEEGDDNDTLEQLLRTAPHEIHDLLVQNLAHVKPHHRESLGLFLSLARYPHLSCLHDISDVSDLALMSAVRLPGRLTSHLQFAEHCQRTRKQIIAQSCGLLEVQTRPLHSTGPIWQATEGDDSIINKHCSLIANRVLVDEGDSVSVALVSYERTSVEWLHRSIFDVVSDTSNSVVRNKVTMLSEEDVLTLIVRAKLRLLALMPSTTDSTQEYYNFPKSSAERVADVIGLIACAIEGDFAIDKAFTLLDEVWSVFSCFNYKNLGSCDINTLYCKYYFDPLPIHTTSVLSKSIDREKVVCADLFSTLCIKWCLTEYMQQRLDMFDCFGDNGWLYGRMMRCCYYFIIDPLLGDSPRFGRFEREATDDFARTVASFIQDALPYIHRQRLLWGNVDPEPASAFGYALVGRKTYLDVSWTRRCDSDHAAYEDMMIPVLAVVYRMIAAVGIRSPRYQGLGEDDALFPIQDYEVNILDNLQQFLGYWDVFIGLDDIRLNKLKSRPISIQVSPSMFRQVSFTESSVVFPSTNRKGHTMRMLGVSDSVDCEDLWDHQVDYNWKENHFVFHSRLDCGPAYDDEPDIYTVATSTLHKICEEVKEDLDAQLSAQQHANLSRVLTEWKLLTDEGRWIPD